MTSGLASGVLGRRSAEAKLRAETQRMGSSKGRILPVNATVRVLDRR